MLHRRLGLLDECMACIDNGLRIVLFLLVLLLR
jgi:hypothetical protein